jgi:hypothetical protein
VVDSILYFANPSTPKVRDAMKRRDDLGAILTPKQGNKIPDGVRYCLDNGVYGKGFPGEDKWFAWLSALPYDKSLCEFAVAPDVVADAAATIARSLPWLPKIRALGLPAAFVAQDGQEDLPVPWDQFDVLFIGGSTEWKLGRHSQRIAFEARRRGKRVHMGRVNSHRRLITAALSHACDSADGTYIAFGPDVNLVKVERWLDDLNHHNLFGVSA